AAGVEAHAGDLHDDVAAVGVDGDPAARTGRAPAGQQARGQRRVEQAGAGEGEGDRARAVIARGRPAAVAAAPEVRGLGDDVAGADDVADDLRRVLGRDAAAVGQHAADRADGQ